MRIHHATLAKAAKFAVTLVERDDKVLALIDGVGVHTGPSGKAVLEDILADLGRFQAVADEYNSEAARHEAPRSIVKPKYRAAYREVNYHQSNGDAMARRLRELVTVKGVTETGKRVEFCDRARLDAIAAENGLVTKGVNPGHVRMVLGNCLRGKLKRGEAVSLMGEAF